MIKIRSGEDCFCYLIQRDGRGKITILEDAPLAANVERTIRPVSGSGFDAYYVIVSGERQRGLEDLIASYRRNPNSSVTANALYNEILEIQSQVYKFGEPGVSFTTLAGATIRGPELPVNLRVRGDPKDMSSQTVPIDLNDLTEAHLEERLDTREAFADLLTVLDGYNTQVVMDFLFPRPKSQDGPFIAVVRRSPGGQYRPDIHETPGRCQG